jgi:hypothetical protein
MTRGGMAPIGRTPEEVYKATFKKVIERNKAYYVYHSPTLNSLDFGIVEAAWTGADLFCRRNTPKTLMLSMDLLFISRAKGGLHYHQVAY